MYDSILSVFNSYNYRPAARKQTKECRLRQNLHARLPEIPPLKCLRLVLAGRWWFSIHVANCDW